MIITIGRKEGRLAAASRSSAVLISMPEIGASFFVPDATGTNGVESGADFWRQFLERVLAALTQ